MPTTTTAGPKGLYPDFTFIAREVLPDALLYQLATIAGAIQGDEPAIRVPYIVTDPTPGFVAEGDEIAVDEPELDEVLVRTSKLAHIMRQTNESAASLDASELLATSMSRAMTHKANTALLTNPITRQDPADETSPVMQPIGLVNTPGITDAGLWILATDNNFDPLMDALTTVQVNGGEPTHITTDPLTWARLSKLKQADSSNVPLLGSPSAQVDRTLFGLPVIVTAALTTPGILITDQANIVAADATLQIATSDQHFFGSDSLARRATWRIGWNMVRPNRSAFLEVEPEPAP